MYATMRLHNFIKMYLGDENDIYLTPIEIPDNAESDGGIPIM